MTTSAGPAVIAGAEPAVVGVPVVRAPGRRLAAGQLQEQRALAAPVDDEVDLLRRARASQKPSVAAAVEVIAVDDEGGDLRA